ncbi:CoA-acylating methylmalonate-semialdehyde dehydrogenase [Candidatus Halocynthiibacter alkanivorans]|uniref:CoA-acylating methylmalonate-semialdehyde dehydrogenase n=1 Tax=Candidatus Halocynthiibacter alkanivorans TaxID=2267619 RepID=UPI00190F0DB5|nr:CoA-acylating methylmalonate-semialdehyde dehydrogenase [Candidatus Halocynthiibacter alkanivorans]
MTEIGHFINGSGNAGNSGRNQAVHNSAIGASERKVALASVDEVNAAVAAAQAAFPAWSKTPPLRRARILEKFKNILIDRAGELAATLASEHGKTHENALGKVTRGLEVVEFAVGAPHLMKGDVFENVGTRVDSTSLRQALGVVVGITSFNFPFMELAWMFPIAIACGNTFVLKPSERVPSASLLIADWLSEAGLPDGVFNAVNGDKEAVDALLTHSDVKAISFVGSTPIAKYIYETGTANGKRVKALGGAKNHAIILPDAAINVAVEGLMGAAFGFAGERCMAISVAMPVTDAVAGALIEKLVPKIKELNIGPTTDQPAEMGPLITAQHLEKVKGYIDKGEAGGGKIVVDGRTFEQTSQGYENGYFIGGTLIDGVTEDMTVWKEEIFGRVLSIVRRDSFKEAVDLVHSSPYGNGVAIYTGDGDASRAFAHDIQVGMVGINVPIPVPMAFHSSGGWKDSLFGDHHMHGPEGVRFYTKLKPITTRWPRKSAATQSSVAMPTLGCP